MCYRYWALVIFIILIPKIASAQGLGFGLSVGETNGIVGCVSGPSDLIWDDGTLLNWFSGAIAFTPTVPLPVWIKGNCKNNKSPMPALAWDDLTPLRWDDGTPIKAEWLSTTTK